VSGVGAWVEPTGDGALVVSIVPDSPADRAGLQPGDRILAVGDQVLSNLDRDVVMNLLRGPAGTSVALAVRRGQAAPFSAEVVRADFPLPTVEVRRPAKDVAYLRIASFAPGMVTELDQALASLATDPPAALILDLRDNPGGDLAVLREAAARFTQGTLYDGVDRAGKVTPRGNAEVKVPQVKLPPRLIVLVNGGTASAAEMLAGALRDNASTELVGAKTFGKGTIQAVETLADHSLLRFTVAEWTTPSGTRVQGVGLVPDKVVEVSPEDRSAKRDPQLEAAIKAAEAPPAAAGG
jgi:carboxyl-terminal processing protease